MKGKAGPAGLILPRYPIYIPSKGRPDRCLTADFLIKDGVPFHLVVEPQEHAAYVAAVGEERVLSLPFRDLGSVIPARNWIKGHAEAAGFLRHWQLDDNIGHVVRMWRGKRIRCNAGVALAATEDFVDRYENVAVAGLNYSAFGIEADKMTPFYLNVHVYSCTLVLNSLPHQWRGLYNEDTDYCLQVLADGWCTVLVNVFLVKKIRTMTMKGGNTDELYKDDGRLKMSRSLERLWPGVVKTIRRYGRPQHNIYDQWKRFDTPLKRRADVDFDALGKNEYGMELVQVAPEIKSAYLKELVRDYKEVS